MMFIQSIDKCDKQTLFMQKNNLRICIFSNKRRNTRTGITIITESMRIVKTTVS